jgi:sulfur-oxidizing protein SoxX
MSVMVKRLLSVAGCACLLAITFLLHGCNPESRGFNLPKGNVEQGRANFVLMQCNDCHAVEGVPFNGAEGNDSEGGDAIRVNLGGKTTQIKTYGDLVTSIINPSHKLSRRYDPATMTEAGESKMRNYNDVMSVQELIDLVEFLQSKYEIWVPNYYSYGV